MQVDHREKPRHVYMGRLLFTVRRHCQGFAYLRVTVPMK